MEVSSYHIHLRSICMHACRALLVLFSVFLRCTWPYKLPLTRLWVCKCNHCLFGSHDLQRLITHSRCLVAHTRAPACTPALTRVRHRHPCESGQEKTDSKSVFWEKALAPRLHAQGQAQRRVQGTKHHETTSQEPSTSTSCQPNRTLQQPDSSEGRHTKGLIGRDSPL